MAFFVLQVSSKLISRKIWVIEKSWNFHTVHSKVEFFVRSTEWKAEITKKRNIFPWNQFEFQTCKSLLDEISIFWQKRGKNFVKMSYFFVVGGKNELLLEPVGVALAVADLLVENCLGVNIVKSKNFVKILLFFATKSCFFFCLFWFWKVAFSATFVPATHATLNHKYRRDLMKFNEFCEKWIIFSLCLTIRLKRTES